VDDSRLREVREKLGAEVVAEKIKTGE